jgi:stress response protein YsnF
MAENQPQKAGEYERPMTGTSSSMAIQRVVDGPMPVREENDTTIISVVEEVLVVEKRWMLREEIHIRKQRMETHQPQRITLRSEEVQIERVPQADKHT